MEKTNMNKWTLTFLAGLAFLIILAIELIFRTPDGAFLLTFSFWVAFIQGSVAVAAAADTAQGNWIKPLKNELLSLYPLTFFVAFLFLVLGVGLDIYPWRQHPGRWLNSSFFMTRNFVVLLVTALLAFLYARAVRRNDSSRKTWAVLYLFSFVLCQSLIAFDWIMPLEFPWVSTMLGGIFFMEAFYAGLAFAVLSAAFILRRQPERADMSKALRDAATFSFGFALAWAGLFYGQFLVIWYGNLPEETIFFTRRVQHAGYHVLFYAVIFMLFIIPFVVLIPRKAKTRFSVVVPVALIVLGGIIAERVLYIAPDVAVSPLRAVVEFLLMGGVVWLYYRNRQPITPDPENGR